MGGLMRHSQRLLALTARKGEMAIGRKATILMTSVGIPVFRKAA